MKQDIICEALRRLKAKPSFMRKVNIFAAVGVVDFLITGPLVIWARVNTNEKINKHC